MIIEQNLINKKFDNSLKSKMLRFLTHIYANFFPNHKPKVLIETNQTGNIKSYNISFSELDLFMVSGPTICITNVDNSWVEYSSATLEPNDLHATANRYIILFINLCIKHGFRSVQFG